MMTRVFLVTAALMLVAMAAGAQAHSRIAQSERTHGYTVNGTAPALEMQQLMMLSGLPPGDYYLRDNGDFGPVGGPPLFNVNGGPPVGAGPEARNRRTASPPDRERGAVASGNGPGESARAVVGARIFWVYSPSMFSGARGGSSGYIHLCPNGIYYRSSEGSISVGGEYNSGAGRNDDWAGMAQTSRNRGRWAVENGAGGPVVAIYNADGSAQRIGMHLIRQGRWSFGRTKYALERGKASCP